MSKEIPILCSTPIVESLIENRKTMTRRTSGLKEVNVNPDRWTLNPKKWKNIDGQMAAMFTDYTADETIMAKCPYGDVGALLWVRESFTPGHKGILDTPGMEYVTFKDGCQIYTMGGGYAKRDGKPTVASQAHIKWRPSIHMPKWASRIWLQVTNVTLERLHDISKEDAVREGILFSNEEDAYYHYTDKKYWCDPVLSFSTLWESINGKTSFDANPWVWVVEFKILSTTGRPEENLFDSQSPSMQDQHVTSGYSQ